MQNNVPFTTKFPLNKPLDMSMLSPEQLDAEIQKGFDDLSAGRVVSSNQVREEMEGL